MFKIETFSGLHGQAVSGTPGNKGTCGYSVFYLSLFWDWISFDVFFEMGYNCWPHSEFLKRCCFPPIFERIEKFSKIILTPTLCRHFTNSSSPRTWEKEKFKIVKNVTRIQKAELYQKGVTVIIYLENSWADPGHDPHAHGHVGWVSQLDSDLGQRRSDWTHADNKITIMEIIIIIAIVILSINMTGMESYHWSFSVFRNRKSQQWK